MKPIKVLYVHGGTLEKAGTETFMMNVLRFIDPKKVHIDFLVFGCKPGAYDNEVLDHGSKIFRVPYTPKDFKRKDRSLRDIKRAIVQENYDIVHAHMNALNSPVLRVMKRWGIPVRISHSHGSQHFVTQKAIIRIKERIKLSIPKYATALLSCSKEAGDFLYPNHEYIIMNNGIDTDHFRYSLETRNQIRSELNLSEAFVVGHVGRFNFQKNHDFLIDVFYEILKRIPNAHLMLLGEGELQEKIQKKVSELNIENSVTFLGIRDNMPAYYQAMDAFVLPSVFEGLPYVLVEAQGSGLLCVASNTVDMKSKLTDSFFFESLENPQKWADLIFEHKDYVRYSSEEVLKTQGYDVKENVKWLTDFYMKTGEK